MAVYGQGGGGSTGGSGGSGGPSGPNTRMGGAGSSGAGTGTNMTTDLGGRINIDLIGGDYIRTQQVITKGYFSNDAGLLEGRNIHTGSLSKTNTDYYFTATNTHPLSASAEVQFAVTFGHKGGSGSVVLAGNETETIQGATEAIYKQFAGLVLPEAEISGGFKISATGTGGVHYANQTPDDYIYVLVGERARFKDKLDHKSWTIKFKGRNSLGGETGTLALTDDSADSTVSHNTSIFGKRYNIVSGSAGIVSGSTGAAAHRTFGWFYPEAGFMIFSGAELSASIPGPSGSKEGLGGMESITSSFSSNAADANRISSSGFAPNLFNDGNPQNALRMINCMANIGTEDLRLRSSQVQNKSSYYCRVRPTQCNFSTNPTFVSSSNDPNIGSKIRHKSMFGNPNVFITTIGLHRTDGRLVAIAKLSSPIKKNFGSEATIKVNLTY